MARRRLAISFKKKPKARAIGSHRSLKEVAKLYNKMKIGCRTPLKSIVNSGLKK